MTNSVAKPIDLDHVDPVETAVYDRIVGGQLFCWVEDQTTERVDHGVLCAMSYFDFKAMFRRAILR